MFKRNTWFISADFVVMFVFHMWHNLGIQQVHMNFADKESIGCCLLVLSIKYLFLHVLAQWYYFSKSYCN